MEIKASDLRKHQAIGWKPPTGVPARQDGPADLADGTARGARRMREQS
jgi:hypothetical protein